MTSSPWQIPHKIDPRKTVKARILAHNALHWLTRFANSYRANEPGHQHLELAFDAARRAFVTQPFEGDVSVELRLPGLEFQFREGDQLVTHILDMEGLTSAQVEAWALVELLHRGIDRDRFSKQLPYDVPNLMSGDRVEYSPEACSQELAELSDWFGNADIVLKKIAAAHMQNGSAPPVVCWPETFQLGFVIGAEAKAGGGNQAFKVAFSPGDELHSEPYFFIAELARGATAAGSPNESVTAGRIVEENLTADEVAAMLEGIIKSARRRKAG